MRFGNLKSVPWYLRLIVFVFVAGVFYVAFWYFVTSGTRKETKEMEEEIAQLFRGMLRRKSLRSGSTSFARSTKRDRKSMTS